MKVLMIMHDDDTYGAPKSMIKLAELMKNTYKVHPIIITPFQNKVNKECNELNIENYSIPNWRYYVNRNRYFFEPALNYMLYKSLDLFFYSRLNKLIDLKQVDIIHSAVSVVSHGHEISKKYKIPHIWHLRELDPYRYYFTSNQIREMGSNTSAFIAISDVVNNYWKKVGLPEWKIHTIYNGLDPSSIYSKKSYKKSTSKLKIILAGRINPDKKIETAINAISILPNRIKKSIQLDIYGDATKMYKGYEKGLKKLVLENELIDQVHFKGYYNNVGSILKDYDLAFMTSKMEPFGRTTVEYMFAGLPVIASNTGANSELIENGVTGFLYQEDDIKDLSSKIRHLYENQRELEVIGIKAKENAYERYTAEINAERIYNLYKQVLKNG